MREIKFRAWERPDVPAPKGYAENKNFKGKMHYGIQDQSYFGNWLHDNGYIIMQYTGLKDKNGREIYEGDIIGYPNYKLKRIVEFGNDVGIEVDEYTQRISGFYLKDLETPALYSLKDGNSLEVVGNIYENSGLITLK